MNCFIDVKKLFCMEAKGETSFCQCQHFWHLLCVYSLFFINRTQGRSSNMPQQSHCFQLFLRRQNFKKCVNQHLGHQEPLSNDGLSCKGRCQFYSMGGAGYWLPESATRCHSMLLTHKLHLVLIAKLHLSSNQSNVLYNFLMHDTSEHFPARAIKTRKLILKGKIGRGRIFKKIKGKILAQWLNQKGEGLFTIYGTQAFVKQNTYSSNQLWQGKEL